MVSTQRNVILFEVVFLLLVAVNLASARTWTDSTGKFRIDAEFVSLVDGVVTLKKPDGSATGIPLEKLSRADQDFVEESLKRTVLPKTDPKPTPSKVLGPLKSTKDVQVIVADGAGATQDEALKDAFRNAVRQVVGAVIDAETVVKNDEVIVDKVLAYSNGFIETYEEVPNSKKNQGGIHRITIIAVVKKGNVVAKLKAASVTVNELDGKGLFAEITTKLDEEKNAEALLRNALEGYPANCIVAEVIGKPEVLKKDEEKATVKMTVRFSPSPDGCKEFGKRLESILDKIARKKGHFTLLFVKDNEEGVKAGPQAVFQFHSLPWDRDGLNPLMKVIPEISNGRSFTQNGQLAVALNTRTSKLGDRMEYRYFIVDDTMRDVLTEPLRLTPECTLTFVSKSEEAIATERFNPNMGFDLRRQAIAQSRWPVSLHAVMGSAGNGINTFLDNEQDLKYGRKGQIFLFSTAFFGKSNGGVAWQKLSIDVSRNIELSLGELKDISTVKCELRFTK